MLADLVDGYRCVTTQAVRQELERGAHRDPRLQPVLALPWLEIVRADALEVLYVFGVYMNRLGNQVRNAGEASVLAWAEVNGASAYVDDQVACNVARPRGVTVRRTLELIVSAVRRGLFDESRAQQLVDALVQEDARFPEAARADLFAWARAQGLM